MIIAVDARPLVTRQIGGAEQHARNIVAQWAKAALPHEFLLLFDRPARETFDDSLLGTLPGNFKEVVIPRFHMPSRFHMGSRVFNTLNRALGRGKVQVYHSFTPEVPRTNVCPVVQTIHDLSFELDADVRRLPASRALRRLTRRGVMLAQRIVAVSSQTKNDISAIYGADPDKIEVIYNGINPVFEPMPDAALRERIREESGLKPPYVLAVGADIPRRNYVRMFAAMESVWQAHPDLRLVMAGRGDWKEAPVYHKAAARGHLDKMVFISAPADAQLAQLYRDATLTCCASSFEGFGLSVLESMACGTPVVCSDMRSLREVADDAAVYFPHDDPTTMGQVITGMLEDAEYRRQLKYRGIARAALFTWPKAAELLLSILERTATPG